MAQEFVPATATFAEHRVLIRVQVSEGSTSDIAEDDPERDVGIFRRDDETEPFDLADLGRSIAAIAEVVTGSIRTVAPDEAEVEFGVDVGVESGQLTSMLVKGSAHATVNVRLLWKRTSAQQRAEQPAAATGG